MRARRTRRIGAVLENPHGLEPGIHAAIFIWFPRPDTVCETRAPWWTPVCVVSMSARADISGVFFESLPLITTRPPAGSPISQTRNAFLSALAPFRHGTVCDHATVFPDWKPSANRFGRTNLA
jgi:hypothetical protein